MIIFKIIESKQCIILIKIEKKRMKKFLKIYRVQALKVGT